MDEREPSLRLIAVEAGSVPCLELGSESGAPMVLLVGLSDGLAPLTEPATRRLLGDLPLPVARWRSLVLSYPVTLPAAPTTRWLAACVADALDQLIPRPAVVVGHSLGAMVAQHLAADRPDLVEALVLSAGVARADVELRSVLRRWDGWIRRADVRRFARDALEMSFTGPARRAARRTLEQEPPPAPPPAAVARHLALSHAAATHDATGRLGAIAAPSLVLGGELDEVAVPTRVEELAAALPDARLQLLAGLGHAFPEQDPDGFERRVTAFLAGLGALPSHRQHAQPTDEGQG